MRSASFFVQQHNQDCVIPLISRRFSNASDASVIKKHHRVKDASEMRAHHSGPADMSILASGFETMSVI